MTAIQVNLSAFSESIIYYVTSANAYIPYNMLIPSMVNITINFVKRNVSAVTHRNVCMLCTDTIPHILCYIFYIYIIYICIYIHSMVGRP